MQFFRLCYIKIFQMKSWRVETILFSKKLFISKKGEDRGKIRPGTPQRRPIRPTKRQPAEGGHRPAPGEHLPGGSQRGDHRLPRPQAWCNRQSTHCSHQQLPPLRQKCRGPRCNHSVTPPDPSFGQRGCCWEYSLPNRVTGFFSPHLSFLPLIRNKHLF